MSAAMLRFIAKGWVRELYIEPVFHFSYPGFEWVQPWPAPLMYAHFVALALLAIGVALGLFYRACITLFFLGFTYVELLDQTAYLNHYYLISLLSGLLIFLPAHRVWSLDAWRNPGLRTEVVPAWCLNILRFQVAVVYIFAGVAKLNADWLFRAQPLRIWLAARSDLPLIGHWLERTWVAYAASWFGAAFDCSIVFFLLCRRIRKPAFVFVVCFHVATWVLFNIGMFPWIMIVAATLLLPADWPRRLISKVAVGGRRREEADSRELSRNDAVATDAGRDGSPHYCALPARSLGAGCSPNGAQQSCAAKCIPSPLGEGRVRGTATYESPHGLTETRSTALIFLLLAYVIVQLALPLRPYLSSQPSAWTCSGFNCAWQVMIVEKTGYAEFYSVDPSTGRRSRLSLKDYLTPRQEVMMAQDPYLVRDMARRLAADLTDQSGVAIHVTANAVATLNGHPSQQLINPNCDLAGPIAGGWILPLKN
jgi:hypothetical protein